MFEFERFICSRAQIMLVRYHQMTGARGVPSNIPPYIDSPPVPSPTLMTGAMTQSSSTLEQVVALTIAEIASLYNEALHYPMDRCALVMQWLKRCLSFSLFSCKHKCFKSTKFFFFFLMRVHSPVQRHLKFSLVLGATSLNSSNTILPAVMGKHREHRF